MFAHYQQIEIMSWLKQLQAQGFEHSLLRHFLHMDITSQSVASSSTSKSASRRLSTVQPVVSLDSMAEASLRRPFNSLQSFYLYLQSEDSSSAILDSSQSSSATSAVTSTVTSKKASQPANEEPKSVYAGIFPHVLATDGITRIYSSNDEHNIRWKGETIDDFEFVDFNEDQLSMYEDCRYVKLALLLGLTA
jgi:hypothetical protein